MRKQDILEGNIFKALIFLALPIMGTSFLQMAYNLIDMIWIGKLGSDAVAAVGTAGFYTWLSLALVRLIQVGTEVNISQALGSKNYQKATKIANTSIILAIFFAIIFGGFVIFFSKPLINFFDLGNEQVIKDAVIYLRVVSLGMLFAFINPIISCIYNGSGDSKTPFKVNSVGLVMNMILDPIFIFLLNL